MRRVRILQIGDIHYPDWEMAQSRVDAKDRRFAPGITESLQRSSFPSVLRKLRQLASSSSCHGVAFVGDFTTNGQTEYLNRAFQHFTLLCRGNGTAAQTPLLFVPGNHDINRTEALELGKLEKFRGMARVAEKFKWERVPLDQPVQVKLTGSGCQLDVILVNTAIGSWELQNLPGFLRDKLQSADATTEAVDLGDPQSDNLPAGSAIAAASPPASLLDQYYGQLDTPYVSRPMLARLLEVLESEPFGVVVGHHNLLPQKIPRISLYAEIVNSGFVRSQLLALNRPVVYLHGHIHQDPVEVVSDPRKADSKLILISAPEIKDGFNELVFFISEHNDLVGVRLIPHRTKIEDGTLIEAEHCFISTLSSSGAAIDENAFELLHRLKQHKVERRADLLFWNEVQSLASPDLEGEALEDALIMLHASHSLEIDDLNRPTRSWRIQLKGK
ncbi:metallophosphoesterase [Rhizobium lentis]|uniref:metallophosphoesterase n=1 Tax=Rhizobium lentis TaxID=1138194 RepID=UPI001C83F91C|nr:metallophosphoesterase [Rhizobium lentis]MBX5146684.1 metallophosphoesterase [Rhizobium lentis]